MLTLILYRWMSVATLNQLKLSPNCFSSYQAVRRLVCCFLAVHTDDSGCKFSDSVKYSSQLLSVLAGAYRVSRCLQAWTYAWLQWLCLMSYDFHRSPLYAISGGSAHWTCLLKLVPYSENLNVKSDVLRFCLDYDKTSSHFLGTCSTTVWCRLILCGLWTLWKFTKSSKRFVHPTGILGWTSGPLAGR